MRLRVQMPRRRYALATVAASGAMLAVKPVFAQNNGGNNNNNNNDNNNDNNNSQSTDGAEASTSETQTDQAPESTADPASETTNEPSAEPTSTEDKPETTAEPESTTTEEQKSTSTTEEDQTSTTEEPTDTTTAAGTTQLGGGITGGPTLTRGFGIPEYPAATVPPTDHAPFMRHSQAPDGTVFIIVGAVLGAFGLGILLWRLIGGLLLHRSVERAALAQHDANSKAGFPAPPAPFYKYTDQGSNMSLSGGATAGRGARRTNRGPTPSANPSHSNLFFSPTAAGTGSTGNRSSTFLPSGFYAAGGNAGGANHTHSISLTNLRPDSRGRGAARNMSGPSPPDSPSFAARRDISASTLNRPSSQRAPSAYLDDLLADDPGALPPPHMPPSTGPRHSNLGPGSNRF
ncbi:uncharacterized protein F5Z01DRAFT_664708 [Emericellopsis atlantica]|uniref:Uncharacterized protein n=1 Tax=Emericellopsis atlantica TaxID=2614577 RepID=A0A9P7ZEW5_9HYPO|nr:uncharacterized protein F5Z01DRAFT_664708 [Emericellopsis atlantica]KAG9250879.1 hypothetical protein F5Z01DRAFT_664708 [Emericellopsis atlantica]